MEDIIVLYAAPNHLNSISALAAFITKHHPSIPVLILSTATPPPTPPPPPSITHRLLPTPPLAENISSFNPDLLFEVPRLNNTNLRQTLAEISQTSNIKALVLDFFCSAAFEVSGSLNIPTYFCIPTSAFSLCAILYWPTIHQNIPTDMAEVNDYVNFPGGPLIHSADLPTGVLFRHRKFYRDHLEASINMRKSAGIIVNSFYALEARAMEALVNGLCIPDAPTPPVYPFGPLIAEMAAGGGSGVGYECLRWLDLQPRKSVVFLCFGREGVFSGEQLKETAAGLENSGHRFLWAVRGESGRGLVDLLPEGFLERTKGRGFVLDSWAPQHEVLNHDAVGAFVTHCGQNSVLEALASGVPMIGWPLYAEQRMNRVSLVEEMRVALPLEVEAANGLVTAAEVQRRVRELMESDKGKEVRRRVEEMKQSAAAAVRKGGSSVVALEKFMETVTGRSS